MTKPINQYADTLYSLDIIERIKELQGVPSDELTTDERKELTALLELKDEAEGLQDWECGGLLIHNDYFKYYARDLALDIGAINKDYEWPLSHIDWNTASDELKHDYMSVEYMGETFWILA